MKENRSEKGKYLLSIVIVFIIGVFLVMGAAMNGIPVTGGFKNVTVESAPHMEEKGEIWFSIFSNELPFQNMKVKVENIKVVVDPKTPGTLVSSEDSFIWGRFYPRVEKVTVTVRTEELKRKWEKELKVTFQEPAPRDVAPY